MTILLTPLALISNAAERTVIGANEMPEAEGLIGRRIVGLSYSAIARCGG
jgi:hypothetical protein